MFNIEHCVYYSCCMNGNCPIARARCSQGDVVSPVCVCRVGACERRRRAADAPVPRRPPQAVSCTRRLRRGGQVSRSTHSLIPGLTVFDASRYRQLRAFYAAEEMTREASWVDVRLATLSALERKEKEAEDDGRSTGGHQAQGETESGSDSGKEQVAPKKEGQVRRSSRLHHKSERATMVERLARR